MDIDLKNLGKRLRQCRKGAALSQDQVGDVVGLSARTVQNHETGANEPGPETIRKYAALYQVDPRWLTCGDVPGELREGEGLYGMTREKTVEGVTHTVTTYGPREEPPSTAERLQEMLRRILASGDPGLEQAIISNLYAFTAAAEKDRKIVELERRCLQLEKKLDRVYDILLRSSREPQDERRTIMRELYDVLDGDSLVNNR